LITEVAEWPGSFGPVLESINDQGPRSPFLTQQRPFA
jgi:hypothetical protein